jgi:hypothetical protein
MSFAPVVVKQSGGKVGAKAGGAKKASTRRLADLEALSGPKPANISNNQEKCLAEANAAVTNMVEKGFTAVFKTSMGHLPILL